MVAPGAARASSSMWYQAFQADVSGSFSQTAAVSKTNIWAVGDIRTAAGKIIYRPFIRHFNGSSWQAITLPHASGSTADWVSASAADNVWVGGLKNGPIATTVVHQWNGARWAKIPLPAMTYLQGVVALAANNVWAFGTSGTVAYDIFHWTGSKWRYYLFSGINFIPQDISASAPDNVWVSGLAFSGSKQVVAAYRWGGKAWRPVRMPHSSLNDSGPAVNAVSRSNVWIGWFDTATSHELHWGGRRWQSVTVPDYADPTRVVPDGKGGYWFGPQAILTGSTWTEQQFPAFGGSYDGMIRIPDTTSFLLSAGVQAVGSSTQKPTIFRFDL
jgi:hypothetical protein